MLYTNTIYCGVISLLIPPAIKMRFLSKALINGNETGWMSVSQCYHYLLQNAIDESGLSLSYKHSIEETHLLLEWKPPTTATVFPTVQEL